jgi:hypothetical protein
MHGKQICDIILFLNSGMGSDLYDFPYMSEEVEGQGEDMKLNQVVDRLEEKLSRLKI